MNVVLYLDCSNTEILGVFGNDIHLKTHGFIDDGADIEHCVLIVPEKVYLKEWKKWIQGKRVYCERFNEYCGVMGYVHPDNPILTGTQKLNIWNDRKEDYDIIEVNVYKADKFSKNDFEHG